MIVLLDQAKLLAIEIFKACLVSCSNLARVMLRTTLNMVRSSSSMEPP